MSPINIYTVQQALEAERWQLISDKYINLKTPLEMKCPRGHDVEMTFEQWRKAHNCESCAAEDGKLVYRNSIPKKAPGAYRVIALDAATVTTGYAIYDNKKLVAYGTFTANATTQTKERINQVKHWLNDIFDISEPDGIGLEDVQLQRDPQTYKVLANLQGVIVDQIFERKYDFLLSNSSTWRAYAGLHHSEERSAAKKRAQEHVLALFGIKATQDEADAICMGQYFAAHLCGKSKTNWGEDIL